MKEFRLVAFGDSLTYGYGVLSHIAYPSRLARELPEKILILKDIEVESEPMAAAIVSATEKPPEKRKNGWKVRCFG